MNDAKFGIFFTIKKHIVPRCVVLVLMFSNDMIYLRPCHGQHLLPKVLLMCSLSVYSVRQKDFASKII